MPYVEAEVTCPVHNSFRVQQVAGLFDVPLAERATERFAVEVPATDEPWQIGLIVGPSGSGKSTIARAALGRHLYQAREWPSDRAVIECFGERPIKQITGLFTAVGFSSPPAWIKPYGVLSGGERFRCDLAQALAAVWTPGGDLESEERRVVVFDEFTSVVDRTAAQMGSAAIAKAIRGGSIECRFVAVTCHYDVADWLEPDWMVDMAQGTCLRRRLRRKPIHLELFRCRHGAWAGFARHHYLSGSLSLLSRCFLALWNGRPVTFCATLPIIGRRKHWRITRVVTLPDYQGLGIGMRVAEAVGDLHRDEGHRLNITASHPALLAHCRRSPRWRTVQAMKTGSRGAQRFIPGYRGSSGRAVASFEYLGAQSE